MTPPAEAIPGVLSLDADCSHCGQKVSACPIALLSNLGYTQHYYTSHTAALTAEIDAYKECQKDKRRLVREIDVLINGEAGAAKQASLCDLVPQITQLVQERDTLRQERDALRQPFDVLGMAKEIVRLTTSEARLREALEKYGRHDDSCAHYRGTSIYYFKQEGCRCGFDLAPRPLDAPG